MRRTLLLAALLTITLALTRAETHKFKPFMTVGGCFVAAAGWLMRRQALVPVRYPRLAESLAFENL